MTKKTSNLTALDFPSLYQAADTASINAQWWFTLLLKIDLLLIFTGSLLCYVTSTDDNIQIWINIISATLLVIAFFISLSLKYSRFEKTWYGARAVAESVKSLSWQYMTGSGPFNLSLSGKDAKKLFTDRLSALLLEKKNLAVDFSINTKNQISNTMETTRKQSLSMRKEKYVNERIKEQRSWYSTKSLYNKKQEMKYSIAALFFQFIAMLFALYLIKNPHAINLVAVFTTATTCFFTWIQSRKYLELAQAYSLTSQELGIIEANAIAISTENEFTNFVSDAESAISREHTMWIARRSH